jgi:nickel/cobalt transporter (NicO) family protein
MAMGFAGGLVPSPSALLVLVGALAAGRPAYGLALVLAYGAGMAAALTGIGLLLKHARDRAEGWLGAQRRSSDGRSLRALAHVRRLLPAGTATVLLVAGCVVAARGLAAVP